MLDSQATAWHFFKTVTAGVPYAHLGTGELQRLRAAGGGHLCFLFHSLYFPHFLSKHQWRPPQEERRQERAVWRAGPGSTASPSSGDPKALTATLRRRGCPHVPARPPHGWTCAPQAATHRSRGRRGPSSSGTARCSASGTRRRRLLFASCHCPRPPVLRSGIFLTSIFHSAAIKWKMLLEPREVTLK